MVRLWRVVVSTLIAVVMLQRSVRADDTFDAARDAYDRGIAAHARGDFETAAIEFARADAQSPSVVALRAALEEAVRADDPALGAELVERAEARNAEDSALDAAIEAARVRLVPRAGRVRLSCLSGTPCLAALDGAPLPKDRIVWVRAGQHQLVLQLGRATEQRLLEVPPQIVTEIAPTAPLAAPASPAAPDSPDSPAAHVDKTAADKPLAASARASSTTLRTVVWAGVGLSGALAVATLVSGLDTSSKHAKFIDAGCDGTDARGCRGLADDGGAAQLRTNVLLGAAIVVAATTVVLGVLGRSEF
jgi:hypothetical protein